MSIPYFKSVQDIFEQISINIHNTRFFLFGLVSYFHWQFFSRALTIFIHSKNIYHVKKKQHVSCSHLSSLCLAHYRRWINWVSLYNQTMVASAKATRWAVEHKVSMLDWDSRSRINLYCLEERDLMLLWNHKFFMKWRNWETNMWAQKLRNKKGIVAEIMKPSGNGE